MADFFDRLKFNNPFSRSFEQNKKIEDAITKQIEDNSQAMSDIEYDYQDRSGTATYSENNMYYHCCLHGTSVRELNCSNPHILDAANPGDSRHTGLMDRRQAPHARYRYKVLILMNADRDRQYN